LSVLRHLPNLICLARMALAIPIVFALRGGDYALALALFAFAAVSDGLDGFLAKHFNWTSRLGKVLDPLADKLLLVTAFITASWSGLVPWWLAAAAIARDLVISLGAIGFRLWFGELNGRPTWTSKLNTATQILYLAVVMLHAAQGFPPREIIDALALTTLATTIASGADYVARFGARAWAMLPRRA
jgi:cardiolipin synthase